MRHSLTLFMLLFALAVPAAGADAPAVPEKVSYRVIAADFLQIRRLAELNMEVRLDGENTDFVNDLAALPGVQSAVLVSYNGEYMG